MKQTFFNTSFNKGHELYAHFTQTSLRLPAVSIKTIAFWLRKTGATNGNECVVNSATSYFSGASTNMIAYVDGVRRYQQDFIDGKWHKVILTGSQFNSASFLSAEILRDYYTEADIADLRLYDRDFTNPELLDLSDDLPTLGLLARYDFQAITTDKIKEATGNGLDVTIVSGSPDVNPVKHDLGRFFFYGGAGLPGNTPAKMFDQSGNKNHLTQTEQSRQAIEYFDSTGAPYFATYNESETPAVKFWNHTWVTPTTDYTFYMVADITNNLDNKGYLFDSNNHTVLLSTGCGEVGVYYSAGHGTTGSNSQAVPNGKSIITWNLSQQYGISIYVNAKLVYRNNLYNRVQINGGRLAADYFNSDYARIDSKLYSFAAVTSSDSLEAMQDTWIKLSKKYNVELSNQSYKWDNPKLQYFGTWIDFTSQGGMKYASNAGAGANQNGFFHIELKTSVSKRSKVKLYMWLDNGSDAGTFDVLVNGELKFGPKSNYRATALHSPDSMVGEFDIDQGIKTISIRLVQNIRPLDTDGHSLYFHKIEIISY